MRVSGQAGDEAGELAQHEVWQCENCRSSLQLLIDCTFGFMCTLVTALSASNNTHF
jgi:hypothetical protein